MEDKTKQNTTIFKRRRWTSNFDSKIVATSDFFHFFPGNYTKPKGEWNKHMHKQQTQLNNKKKIYKLQKPPHTKPAEWTVEALTE